MSIDLKCFFDSAQADRDLCWLRDALSPGLPELTAVIAACGPLSAIDRWLILDLGNADERLFGPGGFVFRFREGTLELDHAARLSTFASHPTWRDPLRRACWRLARELGSRGAIYAPEFTHPQGRTLREVEQWLRASFGPPAGTFEQLARAEPGMPRSWYVETFADLVDGAGSGSSGGDRPGAD